MGTPSGIVRATKSRTTLAIKMTIIRTSVKVTPTCGGICPKVQKSGNKKAKRSSRITQYTLFTVGGIFIAICCALLLSLHRSQHHDTVVPSAECLSKSTQTETSEAEHQILPYCGNAYETEWNYGRGTFPLSSHLNNYGDYYKLTS